MEDQVVIHREVTLGKIDAELRLKAEIDGEVIVDMESESLLKNFLVLLRTQMGGDSNSVMYSFYYNPSYTSISNNGGNIQLFTNTATYYQTNDKVMVYNVIGTANIAGMWNITRVDDYRCILQGSVYSGSVTSCNIRVFKSTSLTGYTSRAADQNFQNVGLYVGYGSGSVDLSDAWLHEEVFNGNGVRQLAYGTSTVAQDTYDSTTCQITFTRSFVNNSGAPIVIYEAGLVLYSYINSFYNSPPTYSLMTRDLFAGGLTIQNGKTLTLSYLLRTVMDSTYGGFTNKFMSLMYRMIGQTTRDARDIDNNSNSYASSISNLKVATSGGGTRPNYLSRFGEDYGPQVGTGSATPSTGDYNLQARILHGTGSAQLLHYGTGIGPVLTYPTYCSFDIFKIFENKSGGTFSITETGLFAASNSDTTYDTLAYSHCIMHDLLPAPTLVFNNQIVKVIYTLKVVL